jgi:hypothetical protein
MNVIKRKRAKKKRERRKKGEERMIAGCWNRMEIGLPLILIPSFNSTGVLGVFVVC